MNTKPALLALASLGLSTLASYAHPIAVAGTEGFAVLAGSNPVIAKYEGTTAGFSNDLYLELDALGNPVMDGIQANDLFIFNNHASIVGSTMNLGTFTAGTELVFRIHVNDTGEDFFSGLASRNADGLPHARAQGNWLPMTTLVSFEDLLNLPEGASSYNDLSFSFENTTSAAVPETLSSGLWLGLAAAGAAWKSRRAKA